MPTAWNDLVPVPVELLAGRAPAPRWPLVAILGDVDTEGSTETLVDALVDGGLPAVVVARDATAPWWAVGVVDYATAYPPPHAVVVLTVAPWESAQLVPAAVDWLSRAEIPVIGVVGLLFGTDRTDIAAAEGLGVPVVEPEDWPAAVAAIRHHLDSHPRPKER